MDANTAAIMVLLSVLALALFGKAYFDYNDRHQSLTD